MNGYGQVLMHVTNEALQSGVAAQEIILHLEMLSHELKSKLIAQAEEKAKSPPAIYLPSDGRIAL